MSVTSMKQVIMLTSVCKLGRFWAILASRLGPPLTSNSSSSSFSHWCTLALWVWFANSTSEVKEGSKFDLILGCNNRQVVYSLWLPDTSVYTHMTHTPMATAYLIHIHTLMPHHAQSPMHTTPDPTHHIAHIYTHCNMHTCVCFLSLHIRFSFLLCQLLIRCTLLLLSSRLVELGCHPGPGARGHCWGFCVAACDHKDNRILHIQSMTTMSHMTGVASLEMAFNSKYAGGSP